MLYIQSDCSKRVEVLIVVYITYVVVLVLVLPIDSISCFLPHDQNLILSTASLLLVMRELTRKKGIYFTCLQKHNEFFNSTGGSASSFYLW